MFGMGLASKLSHEVYDYAGLGFLRDYDRSFSGGHVGNSLRDHLAIDRFFGTDFSPNPGRFQFCECVMPCPGSLLSLSRKVATSYKQVFNTAKTLGDIGFTQSGSLNSIWAATKNKTSIQNAYRHWKDHKEEFSFLQNSKQYVEATRNFVRNPPI